MLQKKDFIERLAAKGYTKADAAVVIDDFILTLKEALIQKESVAFHGFGKFEVREHKGRQVVSPTSGELVDVPNFLVPTFTAGDSLKRAVKEGFIRG